jgi:hypothetical protein
LADEESFGRLAAPRIANFPALALNSGVQPADLPAGGNSSTLNFTEPANLLLRRLIIS